MTIVRKPNDYLIEVDNKSGGIFTSADFVLNSSGFMVASGGTHRINISFSGSDVIKTENTDQASLRITITN